MNIKNVSSSKFDTQLNCIHLTFNTSSHISLIKSKIEDWVELSYQVQVLTTEIQSPWCVKSYQRKSNCINKYVEICIMGFKVTIYFNETHYRYWYRYLHWKSIVGKLKYYIYISTCLYLYFLCSSRYIQAGLILLLTQPWQWE